MTVRNVLRQQFLTIGAQSSSKTSAELTVTLQLFQFTWVVIAVTVAVFAIGLLLSDFQLRASGYLVLLGMGGLYGLFGYLNATSEHRSNPRIYSTLFTVAQIILLVVLLTSIGYIAASANLPMQDARLLAFDRSVGLDFRPYLNFINDRPLLIQTLGMTYNSFYWQLLSIVLVLPLIGHHRRAAEFNLAFAMTLIVTTAISTLIPATGVYGALGLKPEGYQNLEPACYYATLHQLPLVRDGTTRLLDAFHLGPILTFPSFHTICAVLYGWAFWPIRWLRGVGLLWNSVMVVATPVGGGHYFADVLAGLVIAALSIYAVKRIGARIAGARNPTPPASPRSEGAG